MVARAVDDAALRLRDLRAEEWESFGLAALAFGVALGATQLQPSLALPFFLGALFVAMRGMRAVIRHALLLDDLTGERDAYVIAEVRERALREATLERRRMLAASLRTYLPADAALGVAADELAALVTDLENEALVFDPACAVACARLLRDHESSPLLNRALPTDEVRSRAVQIRGGFTPRRSTDDWSRPVRIPTGNPQGAQGHRRFPWRLRGGTSA